MAQALPVSRIVNVNVVLTPVGAQAQSLRDLLLLGTSDVLDTTERMRAYADVSSIATDFGTDSVEYKAALLWFSQSPQPTQIYIGRWVDAAAKGGLRCGPLSAAQRDLSVWTAITDGAFRFRLDGAAEAAVSGIDFSAVTNLNGVASLIAAELTGVDVVWNESISRFEFTSQTTGITSAFNFLTAPVAGTDLGPLLAGNQDSSGAYTFLGQAAETIDDAMALFDDRFGQRWYAVVCPDADSDEQIKIAAFVEASINKHILGVTTQEAAVLVAASTSDVASRLKALGYTRALVQYSSSSPYAICSVLARALTVDYNGSNTMITLKFKKEPGVEAETLPLSQVTVLQSKKANIFVNYSNDTAILEQGVMTNGEFIDVITGTDWLGVTIQTALYNLLYTSTTKIPQTDQGQQILLTGCEQICAQAVVNGLLAPGVWNAGGFGQISQGDFLAKGYYIYSDSFKKQQPSDRAARHAMPIQIAAKLAGAIHDVNVTINVNQ